MRPPYKGWMPKADGVVDRYTQTFIRMRNLGLFALQRGAEKGNLMGMNKSNVLRWVEFCCLYLAVPVVVTFCVSPRAAIPTLWGGAVFAWWLLRNTPAEDALLLRDEERVPVRKALGGVLARFAVGAVLLAGLLWWCHPELLLKLPREKPMFWGLLCVAYPVVSVFPQVIIYRCLFIRRYSSLFASKRLAWFIGALAFGLAHLPFRNAVALLFPFVGGFLFIRTYQRTQSVALNVLEHSLYGGFLFTIGWGEYLLYGTRALMGN